MRKRIRKKKHIGEFKAFGVHVSVVLADAAKTDRILDDLIQFVESNGMAFGGTTKGAHLEGIVELGAPKHCEERLQHLTEFFEHHDSIATYVIGKMVDVAQSTE